MEVLIIIIIILHPFILSENLIPKVLLPFLL